MSTTQRPAGYFIVGREAGIRVVAIGNFSADNAWDYENAFYWFSAPSRLDKALAQYEIYRQIATLPGDVIELGVYKAASLVRLATFRRLLETETSRRILGFDAFGAFPVPGDASHDDRAFIADFEAQGGAGLPEAHVRAVLDHKGFTNIQLVAGDILQTLPHWLEVNPHVRLSLIHLDTDVYSPASMAIDLLWPRLVPGGILMIDDYNAVEGETRAVDELLRAEGLKIEKLPFYATPAFIVKPIRSQEGQ